MACVIFEIADAGEIPSYLIIHQFSYFGVQMASHVPSQRTEWTKRLNAIIGSCLHVPVRSMYIQFALYWLNDNCLPWIHFKKNFHNATDGTHDKLFIDNKLKVLDGGACAVRCSNEATSWFVAFYKQSNSLWPPSDHGWRKATGFRSAEWKFSGFWFSAPLIVSKLNFHWAILRKERLDLNHLISLWQACH